MWGHSPICADVLHLQKRALWLMSCEGRLDHCWPNNTVLTIYSRPSCSICCLLRTAGCYLNRPCAAKRYEVHIHPFGIHRHQRCTLHLAWRCGSCRRMYRASSCLCGSCVKLTLQYWPTSSHYISWNSGNTFYIIYLI